MKIWFINHYAVPPQYYPLARPSLFAKNLIKMGHDVTIIAASTVHNSASKNLIETKERVREENFDGIPYVLINCTPYQGNGLKRVANILEFAYKLPKVLNRLPKPDAIIATSFDPISCYAGVKYAKRCGIKCIAEIADLWPETLVAYGGLSRKNPIVKYLKNVEKRIYTQADRIVFTMQGAYDYIIEQGWEEVVQRSKVRFINNGIDLEQFDYNREHFHIEDEDLKSTDIFKVVYTGSIRKVNNVGKLLDVAKLINNQRIRFLIWGDGEELSQLEERIAEENITNVLIKGRVDKKYIPYITSLADLNIIHNNPSALFRFGISFNKMFDYLAAGRPTLTDFPCQYNPAIEGGAGIMVEDDSAVYIAKKIDFLSYLDKDQMLIYGTSARRTAEKYDFGILTRSLLNVIEEI